MAPSSVQLMNKLYKGPPSTQKSYSIKCVQHVVKTMLNVCVLLCFLFVCTFNEGSP